MCTVNPRKEGKKQKQPNSFYGLQEGFKMRVKTGKTILWLSVSSEQDRLK